MIASPAALLAPAWRALDAMPDGDAEGFAARYAAAAPFPHIVIDGLFDAGALAAIGAGFAELEAGQLQGNAHRLQHKIGTRTGAALPDAAQAYVNLVHSGPFVRLLQRVTGIADLLPDPALFGGGMHEMPPGGRFELHTDFLRHPRTGLDNRLVVITYLNEGWEPAHGGALELWRMRPRERVATVVPSFGRTIVMAVGPDNLHGLPEAVRAPGGRPRRSIATYYYTSAASTRGVDISTRYHRRPGADVRDLAIAAALALLPPVVVKGARRLWGTRRLA